MSIKEIIEAFLSAIEAMSDVLTNLSREILLSLTMVIYDKDKHLIVYSVLEDPMIIIGRHDNDDRDDIYEIKIKDRVGVCLAYSSAVELFTYTEGMDDSAIHNDFYGDAFGHLGVIYDGKQDVLHVRKFNHSVMIRKEKLDKILKHLKEDYDGIKKSGE